MILVGRYFSNWREPLMRYNQKSLWEKMFEGLWLTIEEGH